jgi:hypothetical protein
VVGEDEEEDDQVVVNAGWQMVQLLVTVALKSEKIVLTCTLLSGVGTFRSLAARKFITA